MPDESLNIVIGGEAGQGLVTLGDMLTKGLVRAGYEVLTSQGYQSRIRGGHNTYEIRVDTRPVRAPKEPIDLLVALDAASVDIERPRLADKALILVGQDLGVSGLNVLAVPYKTLCPKPLFENTAALGVLARLLCLERSWLEGLLTESFHKKGDEVTAQNLKVFAQAQAWAEAAKTDFTCLAPPAPGAKRLCLNGNEGLALGAMAGGVNFCSFYPMTPATSVASALIEKGGELGVVVEQAEDEIAAVNMALGASYAGATALVPTSGGGFDLMVEGLSLAGMIETPVVMVLGMRPGPATGLPTRTEQGDLRIALHSGHGSFPRVVLAPGTPEQCFALAHRAVDQAERWQSPVILLTDQYLADSSRGVAPFDLAALPPVTKPGLSAAKGYERFAVTANGVSPRLIPGFGDYLVVADSDEHTPDGHITEDLEVRVRMMDKRMAKTQGMLKDVVPPSFSGHASPEILLTCWGSTLGAAQEAADILAQAGTAVAVLHFSQVEPLNPDHFLPALTKAKRTVMVEGNFEGQLAQHIRQETGFAFSQVITRYDGLPFTAKYILDRL